MAWRPESRELTFIISFDLRFDDKGVDLHFKYLKITIQPFGPENYVETIFPWCIMVCVHICGLLILESRTHILARFL